MLTVWFFVYKKLAQFAVRGALPPRRSESPGCAADNKPSCMLHLLGSFIGSRGFSSLEQRPEFWVLQWYLPRLGIKPMSPALAGGFFNNEPPRKPLSVSVVVMLFKNPHLLQIHIEILINRMIPYLSFALKIFQPNKAKEKKTIHIVIRMAECQ